MNDRRRAPRDRRAARRLPFVAAVLRQEGSRRELLQSCDLGLLGMQVRRLADDDAGPGPLPALRLSFELPDGGEVMTLQAQVVFDRLEGSYRKSGLRFFELPVEVEQRLRLFLLQNSGT